MKNNYISKAETITRYPNGAIMKRKPYSSTRHHVTIYFYNNPKNYDECTKIWLFDSESGYNPKTQYSKILMEERNRIEKVKNRIQLLNRLSALDKVNGNAVVKMPIPKENTIEWLW